MDIELKCNIIQCRKKLNGQAFITSCSHIFCKGCAYQTFQKALICPACSTNLPQPSDIFLTDLHPNEDWKSMIISGLPPETIMEICGRSLSFWVYQVFQEHNYKDLLLKASDEKKHHAEKQLSICVGQAKSELSALRTKCLELSRELENEKKKSQDMAENNNEKSKQMKKLQNLCDKLKKRIGNPQLEGFYDDRISQNGDVPHSQNNGIFCKNGLSQEPPSHPPNFTGSGNFAMHHGDSERRSKSPMTISRGIFGLKGKVETPTSSTFGFTRLFQTPKSSQQWSPVTKTSNGFFNHFNKM